MIPIPIGDAPNFRAHRPWVNWILIGANVLVFLWALSSHPGSGAYNRWVVDFGFIPLAPRWETWVTSMFMHGDWMHLGGNMLFLWIFGDNVEGRLGHAGYLFLYLACGLAAVLFYRVLEPHGVVPLVGASGAIFGVVGFYFWAFPRNRVRFVMWFFFVFFFWVNARVVLALYVGFDLVRLLLDYARDTGSGGVAYSAHVGGFACGLLLAVILGKLLPALTPTATRPTRRSGSAPVLFQNARFFLQRGRLRTARASFETLLHEHPESPEAPWAAFHLGHILHGVYGDAAGAAAHFEYAAKHHGDATVRAAAAALAEQMRALPPA